jgi:hypothetical protein
VTVLADAPESTDERSADAGQKGDERNPPQQLASSACRLKTPRDSAALPAAPDADRGAKRSPK